MVTTLGSSKRIGTPWSEAGGGSTHAAQMLPGTKLRQRSVRYWLDEIDGNVITIKPSHPTLDELEARADETHERARRTVPDDQLRTEQLWPDTQRVLSGDHCVARTGEISARASGSALAPTEACSFPPETTLVPSIRTDPL